MFKPLLTSGIYILAPFMMFAALGISKENESLIYSVTVSGILIVIFALTIVAFTVAMMSNMINYSKMKRVATKEKKTMRVSPAGQDDTMVAITIALHLEKRSLEEEEKAILTIHKIIKPFSGWNNKSFGMRNSRIL